MTINICLTKDDISTTNVGLNYMVKLPNGIDIVFTKEAIEELNNDMKNIDAEFLEKYGKNQSDYYHPKEA